MELQKDGSLSPKNPFKTMFVIGNKGYVPVTNMEVDCIYDFNINNKNQFRNIQLWHRIPRSLWHENKVTLPCFTAIGHTDEPAIPSTIFGLSPDAHIKDADMTIRINYQFLGIFRGSQAFHVVALETADKSYRWKFES